MLLPQFIRESIEKLQALYPLDEARSLVLRLCGEVLGTQSYTHIVEPEYQIPGADLARLTGAVSRMACGEPLQYITGVQEFCGRRFRVTPDVLIPRPETEELAATALARLAPGSKPRVLDLFTGSGCIAWTIALERPGSEVTGIDVSAPALAVARSQAFSIMGDGQVYGKNSPVFLQQDILELPEMLQGAPFDIITANPPYIRESEKSAMQRNVLDYEPGLALFVPDEDPLLFYRATARWARRFLAPGAWGIAEINEALGEDTAALFRDSGLEEVEIRRDMFGKDRFISFRKAA